MPHPWSDAIAAINAASRERIGPATKRTEMVHDADGARLEWTGVTTSPVELHKLSGLDRNTYAVARCVASEVGAQRPGEYLLGVAEGVRNEAKRRGVEPYALLTFGTRSEYAWTRGMYGQQHGRWAATSQDPHLRAVVAARFALQNATNLCRDTIRWCSPDVMDGGTQGGRPLRYNAVTLAEKWGAEGKVWIGAVPNVATYKQAWFKEGPATDNAELIRIIEIGRKGGSTVGTDSPDERTRQVAAAGAPWWLIAAGSAAFIL